MTATRIRSFTVEGPAVELFVSDCGVCGVIFGIPSDLERRRREDRGRFYCPNGHHLIFTGETDAEKLRKSRIREDALRDQLTAAIQDGEKARQQLLRDRQRFANGVCPCCNRSFENVRRHMASKHPEYDADQVARPVRYACSCGSAFDTYSGLRVHQGRMREDNWADPRTPKHLMWGGSHLTEGVTQ